MKRSIKKKQVQDNLRKELGLIVDIVKQGKGTTNDGNSARRFFADPVISAKETGLDEEIIYRFAVILQAIASGERINSDKFGEYAKTTAEKYVTVYGWYYMPATVHKILIHGKDIIENALLPIRQLFEEAQEARNKDFRRFREHNTRKFCRTATNEDILNNLLISSDPVISTMRPRFVRRIKKTMFPETIDLLEFEDHSSEEEKAGEEKKENEEEEGNEEEVEENEEEEGSEEEVEEIKEEEME
ncbi:hypothetical protein KPH14_000804 [Odynerus spinipes]|uniref:Uncharacterized protein n=1 Tax=Odynerus spinipes TaxID=1348599 RepID=A0AAD9R8V1_9HYME|nr:hypothetical protein KPH14_000804 [Odynerus spinipes]